MTACDECGGPLDPDTSHVQHEDKWCRRDGCDQCNDCDCPEVCAACCHDPDCPLHDQDHA